MLQTIDNACIGALFFLEITPDLAKGSVGLGVDSSASGQYTVALRRAASTLDDASVRR